MGKILDDSEVELFDCINQDMIEAAGVDINYYAHDTSAQKNRRKVDPLYGEPTERSPLP